MAPIRLTIFEDNRAFRESLLQLFRITKDVEVVGAYPDCSRLRDALLASQPDVILMDIDMPGKNGIEATAEVKAFKEDIQVVMLTVSEEEDRIFQCLKNGATGYLLKKASPDEIIEGVRSVDKGGSPISPAIARKVLQFFHLKNQPDPQQAIAQKTTSTMPNELAANLTPREKEILEGLVDGLSYKMIAAHFNISPETVKNHIQGVYKKLHVNSKGEAISLVLKSGALPKK
ncbi:MAG: response regulator transcription factor [Saprospiraceae bacterium]